jgi:hypothetical protein
MRTIRVQIKKAIDQKEMHCSQSFGLTACKGIIGSIFFCLSIFAFLNISPSFAPVLCADCVAPQRRQEGGGREEEGEDERVGRARAAGPAGTVSHVQCVEFCFFTSRIILSVSISYFFQYMRAVATPVDTA